MLVCGHMELGALNLACDLLRPDDPCLHILDSNAIAFTARAMWDKDTPTMRRQIRGTGVAAGKGDLERLRKTIDKWKSNGGDCDDRMPWNSRQEANMTIICNQINDWDMTGWPANYKDNSKRHPIFIVDSHQLKYDEKSSGRYRKKTPCHAFVTAHELADKVFNSGSKCWHDDFFSRCHKKLVLYQRTVSNMDGSGDPSLIEQVVRKLFYEEEFKHLRFRVDDKEIDVILPNNPDPSNTSSELNDLDKVAQLKNEVRPLLRNILLASMKEYENRIVHSKKMDEIFEIFEEERFTYAAEDMITELEHIDEPIPAKFMHEVIKNVDDHLKKNFDKLVKSNRGASVASASLKKKPEKTRRRVGGTQKEKHNGTKKGKKNSQSNKERQKKKQGKGENS